MQDRAQRPNRFPTFLRGAGKCAVAITSIVTAYLMQWIFTPILGTDLPLLFFPVTALMIVGYVGVGFASTVLAVGLGLGSFAAVRPPSFSTEHLYRYLFCAIIGLGLIGSFHRIRRRFRWVAEQWLIERGARRKAHAALQQARAELRAFSEELDGRISQRTEELQQTIDSLQVVLYHIAHDLRAPLRAMSGFAAFLNERACGELTEEGRKCTERIAVAALRLDKLTNDLLDFGRLSHERLRCQRTDCNEVFSELLTDLRDEIDRSHANVEIASDLPAVHANRRLLQIVFQQLLRNALKFSKPNEAPAVQISVEHKTDAVKVCVQDNGIGIDPQYHEKIFGLFERIALEPASTSTGVGLAIARKAVERMGGRIGVESFPGQGSRFWVEL